MDEGYQSTSFKRRALSAIRSILSIKKSDFCAMQKSPSYYFTESNRL